MAYVDIVGKSKHLFWGEDNRMCIINNRNCDLGNGIELYEAKVSKDGKIYLDSKLFHG